MKCIYFSDNITIITSEKNIGLWENYAWISVRYMRTAKNAPTDAVWENVLRTSWYLNWLKWYIKWLYEENFSKEKDTRRSAPVLELLTSWYICRWWLWNIQEITQQKLNVWKIKYKQQMLLLSVHNSPLTQDLLSSCRWVVSRSI